VEDVEGPDGGLIVQSSALTPAAPGLVVPAQVIQKVEIPPDLLRQDRIDAQLESLA
jgi:hypothetical protein